MTENSEKHLMVNFANLVNSENLSNLERLNSANLVMIDYSDCFDLMD